MRQIKIVVVVVVLGCWTFTRPSFKLYAEKIQSDPFAPPSLFRVTMDQQAAGYPAFATRFGLQHTVFRPAPNEWFPVKYI